MDMRVTTQTQISRAIADVQRLTTDRNVLIEQITSGVKLVKPSDAPSNFVVVQNAKAQNQRLSTYLNTITDSTANLNEGVTVLTEVNKGLSRASQIAQEAINGSTDERQAEALASELDGLLDGMLQLTNQKVNGRFLFAGTATETQPFVVSQTDGNGRPTQITYQGSDERAEGLIGPGQSVDIAYAGNQVFQPSGADVFRTLIALRDDIRNQSLTGTPRAQQLTTRLRELEVTRDSVLSTVGEQSADLANLEALQSRTRDLQLNLQIRTGELEATDYSEAVILLQQQESIFQATIATTAKFFDPGFLRFIQ